MFFRDRAGHEFEKNMAIGGHQGTVIVPIHLELAIPVLMVVLIGLPAQALHGVAYFGDDVIAAHQRLRVVAGFFLGVGVVGDCFAVRGQQEELALDPGLELKAVVSGLLGQSFQDVARTMIQFLAVDPQIGGQPANLSFPGQLDQTVRIGTGE